MEPPDTRWWQNRQSWVGIKIHIGYNQECTTRSPLLSPGRWKRLREDRRPRKGSRYSQTPRPPSGKYPRRSLDRARCTCSRQEGTSQCCGETDRTFIEIRWCPVHKSVPETRRPTSGQARGGRARRPRDGMARMRGRRTGQGHARCRCPDPSCASSERSPRGVGGTPLMGWRGRAPRKKYKMPSRQKLDRVVAGSSKRLVSRFY